MDCPEPWDDSDKWVRYNEDRWSLEKLRDADGCFICHRIWQHISLELVDISELNLLCTITIQRALVERSVSKRRLLVEVKLKDGLGLYNTVEIDLHLFPGFFMLNNREDMSIDHDVTWG